MELRPMPISVIMHILSKKCKYLNSHGPIAKLSLEDVEKIVEVTIYSSNNICLFPFILLAIYSFSAIFQ